MSGDIAPKPEDHHTESGYFGGDYGAAALICHMARPVQPIPRVAILLYATADQAVSAAAHCRAPDAAGHQLLTRDQHGRVRVRRLTDPTPPGTTNDEEAPDDQ